jgi:hypothetical protein
MFRFRWPYALLTFVYCAAIFLLSAQPSLPDRAPPWLDWSGSDKIAHAIVFAGLSLLVYTGVTRSDRGIGTRARMIVPIAFTTLYGLSDEFHQHFVPNRSFDLFDLLADAAGATIIVIAVEFWRRKLRTGELRAAAGDPS